ncbi:MAG: hypothetical protein IKO62_09585 [Bacteroidales bacterium]|nr:hypothetical protein [Bacteroidales bacterium]
MAQVHSAPQWMRTLRISTPDFRLGLLKCGIFDAISCQLQVAGLQGNFTKS